jgi:antitoxin component of MazEF toxin-antitoxin module
MARNTDLVLIGSRSVHNIGGNSTGVSIPPEVLDDMDVSEGDSLEMLYDRSEKEMILNETSQDSFV